MISASWREDNANVCIAEESRLSEIRPDIYEEACRLVAEATRQGVPLRLIGGMAVLRHAPNGVHPRFAREYGDIDLVTAKGRGRSVGDLMEAFGYQPNVRFNTMNGASRLVFYDLPNRRQVDVFVGEFRMCHRIPVAERLDADPETVPLAELLLTKLQIVKVNEKDLHDIYALLHEHDVGAGDDDTINAGYLAELLAGDWGLWRTSTMTLERSREHLAELDLREDDRRLLEDRIDRLSAAIEARPKSLRWKSRARLGDRSRWYEEPDEIAHAEF